MEKLPEGWRWVRLGEVCEHNSGIWGDEPDVSPECHFILRSNNIKDGKMIFDKIAIRKVKSKYLATKSLKLGDILVTTSSGSKNLLGKSAIFIPPDDKIYLFSNFTMRLRAKLEIIDYFYLYFCLQSPEAKGILQLIQDTTTGLRNLDRKEFLNQFIPLPPIKEQKRIATKIQELMQEVGRARTACEKQLESAKTLPTAYLRQIFESKEAKKWERRILGEVARIFTGSSAPQEPKYFENGKHPFVRVQDLGRYGKTINLMDVKDYVNDSAIKEINLVKAEKGNILFPKSGAAITTNNRAILGIDAFIVSHLAAVKPISEIADVHFAYYWLCLTDMVQYMENPGYPSLKLSTISKIFISLPSLEVQRRIATELGEKMAEVQNLQFSIHNQQSALNALPQAILRKAFKGDL